MQPIARVTTDDELDTQYTAVSRDRVLSLWIDLSPLEDCALAHQIAFAQQLALDIIRVRQHPRALNSFRRRKVSSSRRTDIQDIPGNIRILAFIRRMTTQHILPIAQQNIYYHCYCRHVIITVSLFFNFVLEDFFFSFFFLRRGRIVKPSMRELQNK